MSSKYFKYRRAFQRNVHPYDLGVLTGLKKGSDDNHFLLKIYGLESSSFEDYYLYHLEYYLSKDEGNDEKDFLAHVWQRVTRRIEHFERQDPFSSKHAQYVSNIEKLQEFQKFLSQRDKWNIRPSDALLKEKDAKIAELNEKIEELEKKLEKLKVFEVSGKAMIQDEYLSTFMDLIHQIKELSLPSGRKLVRSDYDSPYYKLVAKYFTHKGKAISVDTARNYFVKKDPRDATKGVKIEEHEKLFKIVPKDED
ncbi:hypothetical protein [Sphingobacterium hotanense]|uniref:hypothetical protein n=1 Tax=Sphingobacterium hotanense TaxID=649196 RepID=UPI0021A4E7A1|nr:hypothetical protein [Sphingobacterium hotanense]MCT1525051.1 hypothetical protein [Sphingobacterium hotanense]